MKVFDHILNNGSDLGLHFDKKRYPEAYGNPEAIKEKVLLEKNALEFALGTKVKTVSMHRPSREIFDANLKIPGMISLFIRYSFCKYSSTRNGI